jgi:hypothetical protein
MHPVDLSIIAASATTAVGGIIYGVRSVLSVVQKSDKRDEIVFGDGTPERPGFEAWQRQTTASIEEAARLARVAAKEAAAVSNRLVRIEKEFKPNSGSSIRDQLTRIEQALNAPPRPDGAE